MLTVHDLTYRINSRVLLDKASATIHKGDKVGFVGRNGTGKSTLLRLISGELPSEPGEIVIPRNERVGKVHQEAPSGDVSLIDTVLATDHERTELLSEAETATDPVRIGEIHERLHSINADTAPARAARILAGLGFSESAQQQPCSALSGGWRMRVALASLLFAEPDLLLLDEPTNHLDLEATLWLEGYLKSYSGTLFLVSHDRTLLNKICNRIVHLEHLKLNSYTGNYDQFEQTRRERLELQAAHHAKQQAQMAHMQSFIDRFRAKASKARQAQSRIKALEKMEPIAAVMEDQTVSFDFPSPDELPPPLVGLDRVNIGYEAGKPILRNISMRLDQEDRIALLGANGNGKSTLMKLLAGRLAPLSGEISRSGKLRVGYFAQDQADELDLDATPYQLMARAMPQGTLPEKVRAQLGRFGFGENHFENRIASLSGGEKARLLFALMTREAPHILLMDEPTNHLDVDSRQALIQAMNAFEGAIVLVSHDPHLIELSADRLLLVADGDVKPFDGDLEDYRKLLLEQRRKERQAQKAGETGQDSNNADTDSLSKKDKRKAAAELRAASADLRKAVKKAEKEIEKLESRKAEIENKLADPEIYSGPSEKVQELNIEMGKVTKALEQAEEDWMLAQEQLEEALSA
ncbi:ABC-F family ATP-binding cassette domain-containing protein [Kiloniella sp. b19]|uniref:ABC-F family ATP-binding cassette domain-containing protein n=1 Tax=Kiloniella sp. GXU_MW_B19 TaxID=3141326 RepID=UPI0031CDB4AC